MTDMKPHALSKVIIAESSGGRKYSYLDLLRTPKLRRIAMVTATVWFSVAFTYYGISLNITGFGLNIYLTQLIYGAIEVRLFHLLITLMTQHLPHPAHLCIYLNYY